MERTWHLSAGFGLALLCAALGFGADGAKELVEAPVEAVLRSDRADASPPGAAENPPIAPGKVTWHADFAAACEASRGSGKPVLLFHMLGRLDRVFC